MRLITIALALALVGCGGGSATSGGGSSTPPGPSVGHVAVSSATTSVSFPGQFDLSANASTVTIAPSQSVRNLTANGSDITLGASSTLTGNISLAGATILHVPVGWVAGGSVSLAGGSSIVTDSTAPAAPYGSG